MTLVTFSLLYLPKICLLIVETIRKGSAKVKTLGISSLLSLFLITGGAWAADAKLTSLTGNGMLDTGDGFKPVSAPADMDKGNRLLVNNGGIGIVEYENGCVHKAEGAEIVVIGETCKAGFGWLPNPTAYTAAAVGVGGLIIMDQNADGSDDKKSP